MQHREQMQAVHKTGGNDNSALSLRQNSRDLSCFLCKSGISCKSEAHVWEISLCELSRGIIQREDGAFLHEPR